MRGGQPDQCGSRKKKTRDQTRGVDQRSPIEAASVTRVSRWARPGVRVQARSGPWPAVLDRNRPSASPRPIPS